jgi:hypothetical protein
MRAIRDPAEAAKFASMVIRRYLPDPAYCIFLLGSRASGLAAERADIHRHRGTGPGAASRSRGNP